MDAQPQPEDIDRLIEANGNLPGELMSYVFSLMTPGATLSKYNVGLLDTFDDEKKLLNFLRMEKWLADRPHHPGEAAKQLLVNLYKNNELARGEFRLGGRTVELGDIKAPVLNVYAKDDHIIPPKTTQALARWSAARTTARSASMADTSASSSAASPKACSARASPTGCASAIASEAAASAMKPRLKELPCSAATASADSPTPSGALRRPRRRSSACTAFRATAATSMCSPPTLAEHGARVIAPDLPGRGRSEWLAFAVALHRPGLHPCHGDALIR